jgi:serine/threonine-protein kinase
VTVPDFVGQDLTTAQATAQGLGIQVVEASSQPASDRPAGTVVAQDPPAGGSIDKGGQVKVTVATTPETVAVPDLKGMTEPQAVAAIVQAGLAFGTATPQYDPTVPAGSIAAQSPAAGTQVARGTKVDYVLSKGPEPTPRHRRSRPPRPPRRSPSPTSAACPSIRRPSR